MAKQKILHFFYKNKRILDHFKSPVVTMNYNQLSLFL